MLQCENPVRRVDITNPAPRFGFFFKNVCRRSWSLDFEVGTLRKMYFANRFVWEGTPQARQLRAGFPWLNFDGELEAEFRRTHLEENLRHIRVNLCLGIVMTLAFTAVESVLLTPAMNRIASLIHLLVIVPVLMVALAASFSPRRHRLYAPLALAAGTVLGLSVVAMLLITASVGDLLFPCLLVTTIFIYFMGGPIFYHSLAANVFVALVYLVAGSATQFRGEFGYDALCLVAVNIFCARSEERR